MVTRQGNKTFCLGVDITDTTKDFSRKEFDKMGPASREHLNRWPKRKVARDSHSENKRKKSRQTGRNQSQRDIAAIITGVMQAQRDATAEVSQNSGARMPQHGPHSLGISQVTTTPPPQGYLPQAFNTQPQMYDHHGNRVIEKVNTGPRQNLNVSASNTFIPEYSEIMPTEVDTHADTHCFGKNFVPFAWTDLVCTITTFLSSYKVQEDIKIFSGATVVTLDTGETILIIFGQGLWFGYRMDKSLVNPNQCRSYGVGVCGNQTDPHRKLGFYHKEEFLPLDMRRAVAGFDSRCPTRQELDESRKYFMSDPNEWDPNNVIFTSRYVGSVHQGPVFTSVLLPITNLIDAPFSEFVSALKNDDNKVQFKYMTQDESVLAFKKFGGSIESQDRHHGISLELLARKWGYGVSTANQTL